MSGPTWMYRAGEAKLFASPEEVPAGEGWQDTPVPAEEAPEEPAPDEAAPAKRRGRPPKTEAPE